MSDGEDVDVPLEGYKAPPWRPSAGNLFGAWVPAGMSPRRWRKAIFQQGLDHVESQSQVETVPPPRWLMPAVVSLAVVVLAGIVLAIVAL